MAEGAITLLVTELIKALIPALREIISAARRGSEECRKLKEELESIQSDVEQIEVLVVELRRLDPDAKKNLKMVEDWLQKLKEAIEGANNKVHKFKSATRVGRLVNYRLAKRITAQNTKITKLAKQRMVVHLLLTNMLKGEQSRGRIKSRSKWRKCLCLCC